MDVALALAGLISESNDLLDARDFEGAEEVLNTGLHLAGIAESESLLRFQFGRLYIRWNKISSAICHLNKAAELAHAACDRLLLIQIAEELRRACRIQISQRP